ncbi:MAG TPA: succinate--CoA ligase subunit alpha [Polyangiaceae bacterium]
MSVLVDKNTRVIVQGITGSAGTFHTRQCVAYGTEIVAGVTPGRGGEVVDAVRPDGKAVGIPVYDTMSEAVLKTQADASVIFVPAPTAADAILEAVDAQCRLVVCITEGIPVLDMVKVKRALEGKQSILIGPNCPGIITPGACKIGIMPGSIHLAGRVGLVSRSGTLTYEAVGQLTALGMGQSTCIGIGGDPVAGMDFIAALKLFNDDPDTDCIMLIGEIGGTAEEKAAAYIQANVRKPVAAFIAGSTAPAGKRMGHAGAIISGGAGTAHDKVAALEAAGVKVAPTPAEMASTLKSLLV